jgi:2-polyprenyl-6-methoxyphenol hydroxylase-like FAD-dependent oxidoreductase
VNVLISGAGIAGPTLAYWLLRYGFTPTLVEVAPQPRTGGYVVDFWGLGYDVADKMGLIPDLTARGYHVEEVRFVGNEGQRVGGFKVDIIARATGGRFTSLPRSELALAIYRAIEGRCETVFGERIVGLDHREGGIDVTFDNGKPRTFDLVVGADGLHSGVREIAFGRQSGFEFYLGYKVAAFETKGYARRDELVYVTHGTPGKQLARFAMRDDKTLFFFVFADEDASLPGDTAAAKATLRRTFSGTGWESDAILREMERVDEVYFDRVSQIRMGSWWRNRVALVGDAAFCPSLLAGEGAALAMAAAYVLAGELMRASGRPEPALTTYQTQLQSFIAGKQKAAIGFASAFAPRTRFGLVFRNLITKFVDLPFVAEATILPSLRDTLRLPDYA